jgi:hypothetical protein
MASRLQHIYCSLALSALCLIIAITIIIVNGVVVSNFQKYFVNNILRRPAVDSADSYQSLHLIPANLDKTPTGFIFTCAALAIFVAILGLGRVAASSSVYRSEVSHDCCNSKDRAFPNEAQNKVRRRWNLFARAGSGISVLIIFAGLLFVFVEEYTSSKFHYTDAASPGQHFTRESWTCQMRKQYTSPEYGYFHWTCNDAVGIESLLRPRLAIGD